MRAMKLGRAVVCSALLAAGLLTTGVCAASVAQADFCGAKEDPFSCTARLDAGPHIGRVGIYPVCTRARTRQGYGFAGRR